MNTLEQRYRELKNDVLGPLAIRLQAFLEERVEYPRVDRISTRAKGVEQFVTKASKEQNGVPKYTEPFSQIQDQIGARIVTFFLSDVEPISKIVTDYFRRIEEKLIIPDSVSEFGYVGKHFVLFLPSDLFDESIKQEDAPKFFELQIKTLFQHAWSEANHDLGYKPGQTRTPDEMRSIAFTAAQAWGADKIFDELLSNESA